MSRHPKRIDPGESANCTRATNQKRHTNLTRLTREIAAILAIGAMVGTMFWTSVFGMAGQFGPTPEVGYMLAGVGDDGR